MASNSHQVFHRGDVKGTMQNSQLGVQEILRRGSSIYAQSSVITAEPDGAFVRATFAEIGVRAGRLANTLTRLGVVTGDRVGTLCWNSQAHFEAYLAVPSMGAILHTLNLRLAPEELAYVINHANDRIIIVDEGLVGLISEIRSDIPGVEHVLVANRRNESLDGPFLDYDELLEAEDCEHPWPSIVENAPAAMCYTSGTTGRPKGVVYTHRSIFLHTMSLLSASAFALTEMDRALVIVPMFHVNAWGVPFAAYFAGCDLVMPHRFTQAAALAESIGLHRPTFTAAVPTIWSEMLRYGDSHDVDMSSLRVVVSGGSATSLNLIERFEQRFGVPMIQAWGMTETSPLCAFAAPPKQSLAADRRKWQAKTGRVLAGVEIRLVDEELGVVPSDGESVGEFEIRGPWIASSYFGNEEPEKFHEGWLRTGDIGTLDEMGFMQISDRAKDIIKSGGEWISSVELELTISAHDSVAEAAAVAVADEKWGERPLVCVVLKEGAQVDVRTLRDFLADRVPRWWLPERWAFLSEIPRTSVGKIDKKAIRSAYGRNELTVVNLDN